MNLTVGNLTICINPTTLKYSEGVYWIYWICFPIITLLHVCNIVLLVSIKRLRTAGTWMVVNLSVSDSLLLVIFMFACRSCEENPYFQCALALSYTASMLSTFGITLDRYISVQHSLRYNSIVTTEKLVKAIVLIWIVATVLAVMWSMHRQANV